MNRFKNARNGFMIGNINYMLGVICPFIIRTIMLQCLGNEYLGLNSLFTSILQVLSLSELGVSTAISYYLYKPIAENDTYKINSILYFFKNTYRVIGMIILVISIVISFFLPKLIQGEIPHDINIYILFWIYVSNTVVSYFLFAYKKILLSANQRYDKEMLVAIVTSLFKYGVQILCLIIFRNYYVYVIVFPIATVLDNLICAYVVYKTYPDYKAQGLLERDEIHDIFKNTGGAFCSKIGSTVYLSVDNIVISSFLGLFILGTYNNYYYVISVFTMMFAVAHNAIRPIIGNYWVVEDMDNNWNKFKIINLAYMIATIIICAVCFTLLQKFELLWGGKGNYLGIDIVVYLVINFYISRITAIPVVYLEASGTLWQGKFVPLISAGLNLFLNIILVQLIGLPGIIISSIIAAILINVPGYLIVMNKYIFKKYDYIKYYLLLNIKQLVELIIVAIICYYIDLFIFHNMNILFFVLEAILLIFISCIVIFIFNIKDADFKELVLYIKNKYKKGVM